MKKILKNILILTVVFLVSCQSEYITYTKDESGIYFKDLETSSTTTTVISFGLIEASQLSDEEEIEVTLVGQVKDFDREFIFKAVEMSEDEIVKNPDGTEKDRYKPAYNKRADGTSDYRIVTEKAIIPAGANSGKVIVEFYRTDLATTLETRKIYFDLVENENFKFMYPINTSDVRTTRVSFLINEKIYTPWWWVGDNFPGSDIKASDLFGDYTKKKSLMIADNNHISRETWTYCGNLSELGGIGHLRFLALQFQIYLNEQKAAGNIIYEEDGTTEMVMGEWTLDNIN